MVDLDDLDAHLANLSAEQKLLLARQTLLYKLDPATTLATLAVIILSPD